MILLTSTSILIIDVKVICGGINKNNSFVFCLRERIEEEQRDRES